MQVMDKITTHECDHKHFYDIIDHGVHCTLYIVANLHSMCDVLSFIHVFVL